MKNGCVYILFLIIYYTEGNLICPTFCLCDMVENLRRAACVNKKLVVVETDVPPQVEYLDLSFNQISDLSDSIFLKLKLNSLKIFNISNNKVSDIHMNAFDGLTKLKTLDLSHNSLRYILTQWFLSLTTIQELYLRGNHLDLNFNEQVIDSKSLKVLDLSKCSIINLQTKVFAKAPNLEILDISENYLKQIQVDVILPLNKLTILNVRNNTLSCSNEKNILLKNYTRFQGIKYNDPCQTKSDTKKNVKFERIINDVPPTIERNFWLYDEDEDNTPKNTNISKKCSQTETVKKKDSLFMEIINMSPTLSVFFIFLIGILTGLVIGCSVQIHPKVAVEVDNSLSLSLGESYRRRVNSNYSIRRQNTEDENLMLSDFNNYPESTPMTGRKNLMY